MTVLDGCTRTSLDGDLTDVNCCRFWVTAPPRSLPLCSLLLYWLASRIQSRDVAFSWEMVLICFSWQGENSPGAAWMSSLYQNQSFVKYTFYSNPYFPVKSELHQERFMLDSLSLAGWSAAWWMCCNDIGQFWNAEVWWNSKWGWPMSSSVKPTAETDTCTAEALFFHLIYSFMYIFAPFFHPLRINVPL